MAYTPRAHRAGSPADSAGLPLTHMRHLGRRVAINAWAGFFVAAALILGALIGRGLAGVKDLNVSALVLLGLVVALYKCVALLMARGHMDQAGSVEDHKRVLGIMYAMIGLDYVVLTIALYFVGGTRAARSCPSIYST